MKQVKDQCVKIMPLGGLDAIGKNMTVFEYGEDIIVVDDGSPDDTFARVSERSRADPRIKGLRDGSSRDS